MTYDLYLHRHNFAVWAAARATQRGFTNVDNLRDALEHSDLPTFVQLYSKNDIEHLPSPFRDLHEKWCDQIVDDLNDAGVANVTFGRAAKLVAVYLKVMIVLDSNVNEIIRDIIYPPIDRVLLQNLSKNNRLPQNERKLFRETSWTTLNKTSYYELILTIQRIFPDMKKFWLLEQYWTVTQEYGD